MLLLGNINMTRLDNGTQDTVWQSCLLMQNYADTLFTAHRFPMTYYRLVELAESH